MNPAAVKFLTSAAKFVIKGFAAQGTGMLVEKAFRGDFNPSKLVSKIKRKPLIKNETVNHGAIGTVRARSMVNSDRHQVQKLVQEDILLHTDGHLTVDESRDFISDLDLESRFPYEAANDIGELKSLLNRHEEDGRFRFSFESMDGRDIETTQQLEIRAYRDGSLYEVVQLDSTNLCGFRGED